MKPQTTDTAHADVAQSLLESLCDDYLERGSPAIVDRQFDPYFCKMLGLRHNERYTYSRIERLMFDYLTAREEK